MNFYCWQMLILLFHKRVKDKTKTSSKLTDEKSKTLILRETPAVANNSSSRSNSMLQLDTDMLKLLKDHVFKSQIV